MEALGLLSPMDVARASVQDKIGLFLSGRAKLARLMKNSSLQVQGEANGLYAVQQVLETKLQDEIMPKIQLLSTGVWSSSDLIVLSMFAKDMLDQTNSVNKLERKVGGVETYTDSLDMTTIAMGAGALLLVGIMSGVFFGRR